MRDSVKREFFGYIAEALGTEEVEEAVMKYLKSFDALDGEKEQEVQETIQEALMIAKEAVEEEA